MRVVKLQTPVAAESTGRLRFAQRYKVACTIYNARRRINSIRTNARIFAFTSATKTETGNRFAHPVHPDPDPH